MDFGILYIPNKAASTAAMVLGFLACAVFIYIPLILAYLFVPLYLAVVIMAISGKHKGGNLKFPLLLPLAPFAVSGFLTLLLWPALPTLVNAIDTLMTLIKPGELALYRKDIPDNECVLDFFLFIGGSFGSFLSIISIGSLQELYRDLPPSAKNSNKTWQEIWIKKEFKRNSIGSNYIKPTYKAYKKYIDNKISDNAKDFFFEELSKQFIDQKVINLIWERVAWMFGQNDNNGFYRLESARSKQERIRSLCIRASIDSTPIIKQLRKQFRDGVISKGEAMKSLQADFEKWKTELDLSVNDSNVVCEHLRKKINLRPKQ